MSVISLNFGQCGNQIAQAMYSTLYEDLKPNLNADLDHVCKWFSIGKKENWLPKAVLVDTETKVTDEIKLKLPFSFNNVVAQSFGGSANNWAFGYMNRSRVLVDEVLDKTRKEIENCDFLTSLLCIYSSSGGTGSGISCYILEKIREEYSKKNIVSNVVLPFIKGEIAVQNYNTLLNLSHLYDIVDSEILFENERLHHICKYNSNCENIDFRYLNLLISQQILSVHYPIVDNSNSSCNINNATHILNNLTANKDYKFLQIKTEPNFRKGNETFEDTAIPWTTLAQGLQKQSRFDLVQQKDSKINVIQKIITNTIITRSSSVLTKGINDQFRMIRNLKNYVDWIPKEYSFYCLNSSKKFLSFDNFVTLISNNNSVCNSLDLILEDSWNNFVHGAYMHHYKKFGVDYEYFLNAFQFLENVLSNYKNL